jgi:hypothetical protein
MPFDHILRLICGALPLVFKFLTAIFKLKVM